MTARIVRVVWVVPGATADWHGNRGIALGEVRPLSMAVEFQGSVVQPLAARRRVERMLKRRRWWQEMLAVFVCSSSASFTNVDIIHRADSV
jgi:hypothetical protein